MENTAIEWTDHTFSPWHGCAKVSDGIGAKGRTDWHNWPGGHVSVRMKENHAAGRHLDGRTWDEVPAKVGREANAN